MNFCSLILCCLACFSLLFDALVVFSAETQVLSLDCGSDNGGTDGDGRKWISDSKYITGNNPSARAQEQDPSITSEVPFMDGRIFTAEATYNLPILPKTRYWLRLYFYPSEYQTLNISSSFFSVVANGITLLNNFSASITAQALSQAYLIKEYSLAPMTSSILNVTFKPAVCRKCIYEKLSDEEVDSCPVCNIDLGCLPVEKLRPDHNLQDIRAKIFPFKRKKVKASEVVPSIALPAKRKERSLSSLVVSTPKVPIQTGLTGRRSKSGVRKATAALRAASLSSPESADDQPTRSSSPESPSKISQSKRQDASVAETSREHRNNTADDGIEVTEGKTDLWTPLNCLVEAANRTKSSKSNSIGFSFPKSESSNFPDGEVHSPEIKPKAEAINGHGGELFLPRNKIKENNQDLKSQDKNGANSIPSSVKRRRLTAARKRAAMTEEMSASAQGMLDSAGAMSNRRNNPIWFSLVASEDQKGDASLPQISACYLRIKDGKMPVSLIQKYLVKKLDLSSETEVEIMCRGQPVLPTLQLQNLVDLWFRTGPTSKKVPASVGSSAKDFVMVLSYSRKVIS